MTAHFAAVKPRLHYKEKVIAVKKAKIIDKNLSCLTVSSTGKLNIVKKKRTTFYGPLIDNQKR